MINALSRLGSEFLKATRTQGGAAVAGFLPGPWDAPAFQPGQPMAASPVNYPIDGQLLARIWNFPTNYNLQTSPDQGRKMGYETLRFFADNVVAARKAIDIRKKEICGLDWEVGARTREAKVPVASVNRVRQFWERPDGEQDFEQWLNQLLEAVFVTDTPTLEPRRMFGGQLAALDVVDGTTIKLLVDATGRPPKPPWPRYRQIINGLPTADFTSDELIYNPYNNSDKAPYGRSSLEAAILELNVAMRMIFFVTRWFTDGTIPAGVLNGAEGWTPEQITRYQKALNDKLAGNDKARVQGLVIPAGARWQELHPFDFSKYVDLDSLISKKIFIAFEVQPQEMGMTDNVNKSSGVMQENVTYRQAIRPLTKYLRSMFNGINARLLGEPEVVFTFKGVEPEDANLNAQTDDIDVRIGALSIDDVRIKRGKEPLGIKPFYLVNGIPTPLDQLFQPAAAPAPAASQPAADPNAAAKELSRFETKALSDLRSGRPRRSFASDILPTSFVATVEKELAAAVTEEQVKAVFVKAKRPTQTQLAFAIDRFVAKNEKDVAAFFRTFMRDWAASVQASFRSEKAVVSGQLDVNRVRRTLEGMKTTNGLGKSWAQRLKELFDDAARRVMTELKLGGTFEPGSPGAEAFIERQSALLESELGNSNYEGVREVLHRALDQGMSVQDAADELEKFIAGRLESSPETVARTELVGTANAAASESYMQAGFAKKKWLSARDSNVRDTHAPGGGADGQIVAMNEPFRVGDSLMMYPGDKSGDISEWINCRCTLVPVE